MEGAAKETRRRLGEDEELKERKKTKKKKMAGSQRERTPSRGTGQGQEWERKSLREREREGGPKEARVSECLFEFLAKWPSVRSAGRSSEPAAAWQSQTKSRGFTYYDLHPCPLPLFHPFSSSRACVALLLRQTYARNQRVAAPLPPLFRRRRFCPRHDLATVRLGVSMEENFHDGE